MGTSLNGRGGKFFSLRAVHFDMDKTSYFYILYFLWTCTIFKRTCELCLWMGNLRKLCSRFLDKSAYQKINFLISHPKHMLWVLKRPVSMRLFFWAPKTYVKTDGLENINNFALKNFVCLNLWYRLRWVGPTLCRKVWNLLLAANF